MNDMPASQGPETNVVTVLLLHGATSAHDIWTPLLRLFPATYRVIPLALPGHLDGEPVDLSSPISIDSLSEKIIIDMHRQGINAAHVVGNSLGGWLALELARRGFAESVTAFSPAGSWPNKSAFQRIARAMVFACRVSPILRPLVVPLMKFTLARRWLFATQMVYGERVSETVARRLLLGVCRCPVIPPLIASFAREGAMKPLLTEEVPLNIVWSANDAILPVDVFLEKMREIVPAAHFSILADAGHVPMYDQAPAMVEHIEASIVQAAKRTG
jgi:pimeloyl-ACP methyl ester carboxylesterase